MLAVKRLKKFYANNFLLNMSQLISTIFQILKPLKQPRRRIRRLPFPAPMACSWICFRTCSGWICSRAPPPVNCPDEAFRFDFAIRVTRQHNLNLDSQYSLMQQDVASDCEDVSRISRVDHWSFGELCRISTLVAAETTS